MTLGAGQGKTIVYLLAAMILNRYDQATYKRFLILTTSKALKTQLENILVNHYTIDIDYKTHAGGDFDMLGKFDLVIVDEADLFIRKFGVDFRKDTTANLAITDTDINVQNFNIGADYRLSKSTMVYGQYAMYRGDHVVAGNKVDLQDDNVFSVGVRYDF